MPAHPVQSNQASGVGYIAQAENTENGDDLLSSIVGALAKSIHAVGNNLISQPALPRTLSSKDEPTLKVSPSGQFALSGTQSLYLSAKQLRTVNDRFVQVGALVRFVAQKVPSINVAGLQLQQVRLSSCAADVSLNKKDRLWLRMQEAEKREGKFVTFADCARTAGVAAGINYSRRDTEETLSLATGGVPVKSSQFFIGKIPKNSMAARAEASFYLHAFPAFAEHLSQSNAFPEVETYIENRLPQLEQDPARCGSRMYKYLELNPSVFNMFCEHFGINDALNPQTGIAIVHVGIEDPAIKNPTEHWNFHWETPVAVDGDQYLVLGNLATEYEHLDSADQQLNKDLYEKKALNFRQVNDILNDKYFFKIYDKTSAPFHALNLMDESSAPHGLSLAVASKAGSLP